MARGNRHRLDQPVRFRMPAPARWLNANDRPHHMERARLVHAWRSAAHLHARRAVGAFVPMFPRARIDLTLSFQDRRHRDIGNYAPTAKAIVDGLVLGRGLIKGLGLLADDDDEHLDGPHLHPTHELARLIGYVDVEVTPLDPLTARAVPDG